MIESQYVQRVNMLTHQQNVKLHSHLSERHVFYRDSFDHYDKYQTNIHSLRQCTLPRRENQFSDPPSRPRVDSDCERAIPQTSAPVIPQLSRLSRVSTGPDRPSLPPQPRRPRSRALPKSATIYSRWVLSG